MNNDTYHFYRCTSPEKVPTADIYDYAKGVIGYKNELMTDVVTYFNLRYLGYKTEKELDGRSKLGVRPSRIVKTHYHND